MIYAPPKHWEYDANKELFFLFFQSSEEMLNPEAPDTYKLPMHNTISLCFEAHKIYNILSSQKTLDVYYFKYIPLIIEELIDSIHHDSIFKKVLGLRFNSIMIGLQESKANQSVLLRWLQQINQVCPNSKYIELHRKEIIFCIQQNKDKMKLIELARNFWVSLLVEGYSEEYLHSSLCRYIFDTQNSITLEALVDFLIQFDCSEKEIEIYAVVNSYLWKYFCELDDGFQDIIEINELSEDEIKEQSSTLEPLKIFYTTFFKLKYQQHRSPIQMISYKGRDYDQYSALKSLNSLFETMYQLETYFKHKTSQKQIFDALYIDDEKYLPIKIWKPLHNRPFLSQDVIDSRMHNFILAKGISSITLQSITTALGLHADAISSKNTDSILRTLWSALESLFSNPTHSSERENVIYSILHIIQKTYLLKLLRGNYYQLKAAIKDDVFWTESINVRSFQDYLLYFAKNSYDSPEFKQIYLQISQNPLLRTRTYNLRKKLSTGKDIQQCLEQHRQKVLWHLNRLYRTRNLSTHAGISMARTNQILFNLHNYFDYVINYVGSPPQQSNFDSVYKFRQIW